MVLAHHLPKHWFLFVFQRKLNPWDSYGFLQSLCGWTQNWAGHPWSWEWRGRDAIRQEANNVLLETDKNGPTWWPWGSQKWPLSYKTSRSGDRCLVIRNQTCISISIIIIIVKIDWNGWNWTNNSLSSQNSILPGIETTSSPWEHQLCHGKPLAAPPPAASPSLRTRCSSSAPRRP